MPIAVKPAEINKLKTDVEHLYKTVYQGNGKPSILNQITSIEHRLTSLEEKLDTCFKNMDTEMSLKFDSITEIVNERFTHISYQITREFETDKVRVAGGLQLRAGLVTAIIATVTTFGALLVNHVLSITR